MRDDTLAELLRSPLDDPDPPWRPPRWTAVLVASLFVGVLLGLAWQSSRPGSEEIVTTTTALVAAAPDRSPSGFPAGYTEVGEGIAMRPITAYSERDLTVVVVGVVAEAGRPAAEIRAFPGGQWQLRDVEGRVVDDYEEIRNPQALGTLGVRFPAEEAGAPRTLVLVPLSPPEEIVVSIPLDLPAFPFTTGRSFEIPLAANLRLSGVLLGLDEEGGDVRWNLAGAEALAQVDMVVTLPETAGEDADATTYRSEHIAPPYPFQRQRLPRPAPRVSGEDVVRRSGPEVADPAAVSRATIEVTVYVYRTLDDAVVELDLTDVAPQS